LDFTEPQILQEGDVIVAFAKSYHEERIKEWIYNL